MKIKLTIFFLLTVFILSALDCLTYGALFAVSCWYIASFTIVRGYYNMSRRCDAHLATMVQTCEAIEKDLGRVPVNTISSVIFMHQNMKRSIEFENKVKTK